MIAPARRSSLLAILVLFAALVALAMTVGVPSAQSASYTKCTLSEKDLFNPPNGKPTYNLTLKARSVSCKTAKSVMYAFHRCRSKTGVRCTSKVLSKWTCTGKKESGIETQFDASFTCTHGGQGVKSSYTQNT